LRDIVDAVRAALRWIVGRFPNASITLSGSSAGAHLAACAADPDQIDRLVLLSGIYDLRPLVETYVNDLVGLDLTEAAHLSPLFCPAPGVRTSVVWGENETDAFKLQSLRYTAHVGGAGREIAARNHFDIVHDLFALSESSSIGD
jgi:arylformamidase